MKIIGLTGGVGSGKSYVLNQFNTKFKIPVYDADKEVSKLIMKPSFQQLIKEYFGEDSYINGFYNKEKFRNLFSENEYAIKLMNTLVIPDMKKDILSWITEKDSAPFKVVECALLFESHMNLYFEKIITVVAPYELRVERLIKRGMGLRLIDMFMKIQTSDSEKELRSTYVINNLTIPETNFQVDEIFDDLC